MAEDVTLDVVARESGVSRATASRVMNNRDGVREDVRKRVQAVAESLGYRPNRSAQRLAGGNSSVIGLVVGRGGWPRDPYAQALTQEVARAADKQDQGLMLLVDSVEPREAVRRFTADGLIGGVIISAVSLRRDWIDELVEAKVATVLIGVCRSPMLLPVVDVENVESAAEMVGHLLDTGCQRIGIVRGPADLIDADGRLAGYRLAHQRRSLSTDESIICQGDYSRQSGYKAADVLFDNGVDGVFCANDEMAIGVYRRAIERGISIPDQLALAGFDGLVRQDFIEPQLTSVVQPFARIADTAVSMLIGVIDGAPPQPPKLLKPTIFFGSTTRPHL